ncbi:conserved hypothetical protein [Echinococcus multilocularis]|uniref:MATH domain-containing protein n=1 Tax=Echinococcus multilocularis TaxID=6211 RepID=A0A087VXE3_ECHMU|nr:conserved hypothetical protein [Echinococcus multilocularis]
MESSSSNSPQLQLIRFSQLANQNVQFTFLLPACLVRGFINELDSATFEYGNHIWRLKIVRSSLHIGAYLELVIPNRATVGTSSCDFSLWLDFIFTVVNLKHFSDNQTFTEKQVLFNRDNMSRGSSCLIEATTVYERNFVCEDGRLLVEVELANVAVSLTLLLSPGRENHLESLSFAFGGEVWKVGMVVNWKNQALMNLFCQSSHQTLGYMVSFELLINYAFEVGHRVELLVRHGGGQIELPKDLNTQILSILSKSFNQQVVFVCLRNIRLHRVSLFSLPKEVVEESFLLNFAEDTGGVSWIVTFSVLSECLYIRLMPQEMTNPIASPESIRVIGWSWCFRNDPVESGGLVRQIYVCHQKPTSKHCFQTSSAVSLEVIKRTESLNSQLQRNTREEEKSECPDFTFPGGPNLKVSAFTCYQPMLVSR